MIIDNVSRILGTYQPHLRLSFCLTLTEGYDDFVRAGGKCRDDISGYCLAVNRKGLNALAYVIRILDSNLVTLRLPSAVA